MRFAKRANWCLESNPLSALLEKKRSRGEKILDLTESNPTRCNFGYLKSSILKPFSNSKNLSYSPDPHGLPEAREAVCAYYADKKILVKPEQIFLTASTSEAYSFVFRLLLDPGDLVLAPRPSYPLLDYLADLNDVKLDFYSLRYQSGWGIDLEGLQQNFQRKPKAIIVVNPNNPTGNFVAEAEAKRIVQLCQNQEAAIISDEVFLDFQNPWPLASSTRCERHPLSIASTGGILTFTLSGISKILGLPQMKLSWIVVSGPEKLRREAVEKLEVIADTYLSVNTPSQRALPVWLSRREPILSEIRERVIANRKFLPQALAADGGWYAVLPLKAGLSDDAAAMQLLEKENVLTYPGYFYNFEQNNFLVLSLLAESKIFKEAGRRLSVVL